MDTNQIINREFARKRAEDEAKRADMKQHADKLIQGFEKLDESHAKRAIWELFQNALDLSDNCNIEINQEEDKISFAHNGKPFTTNTLSCLIKQVSSKEDKNNDDEVGQYGTGFITTHSFGKQIVLNSCLKEANFYIPIKNFDINRIAESSDDLIKKLISQQEAIYELVEKGEYLSENGQDTTFTYLAKSELEKENICKAIDTLQIILPYVMVLNKKLKKVTVIDKNDNKTIYEKNEIVFKDNTFITKIRINETITSIYSLYNEIDDITVILPLSDRNNAFLFDDTLSRLFLFYPLIGTEKFGFNYIIHSKHFAPTEPRDGIHLKSKNEQVQQKEKLNRELIDKASLMIFSFIRENVLTISNPIFFADIKFLTNTANIELSNYFQELKGKWIEQFKNFKLVETDLGIKSPIETLFLDTELIIDKNYLQYIYELVKLFWSNVPKLEVITEWTKIVNNWNIIEIKYIKVADIVTQIQAKGNLIQFSNPLNLQEFYKYLIQYSHSDLFSKYKLLPNIKNEFRVSTHLYKTINIDDILIEIADILIPEIPKSYIKAGFEFDLVFEEYDRKKFSQDINVKIEEINQQISKNVAIDELKRNSLLKYCKIFPALDNTATRGRLISQICEFYNQQTDFFTLSSAVNQEINWQPAMKCLFKIFTNDLNKKDNSWISDKISFLKDTVSIVFDYSVFTEIMPTLAIFPNQHFKLCKETELKIDSNIPEDLKDLHDEIVKSDIRKILVHKDFNQFLVKGEHKTAKNLGDEIDKVFQDAKPYSEISDHPYKKAILGIIKKISDNEDWKKFFPLIEEKKATIMMASISDNETKNDLFSIIGLEKDKIALLGKLSRLENFEEIIKLGEKALLEKLEFDADFSFKHKIGVHIEKIIRDKLGADLSNFCAYVDEKQGGQDIIITHNDVIIYRIEVKSRWDNSKSISMSSNQLRRAVEFKDSYALCCVEMSNYKNGEAERYNADLTDILNRINVILDIGFQIEPLINEIIRVDDTENQISITGDYRGTIPQTIVKKGKPLNDLIAYLIKLIENNESTQHRI